MRVNRPQPESVNAFPVWQPGRSSAVSFGVVAFPQFSVAPQQPRGWANQVGARDWHLELDSRNLIRV